MDIFFIAVGLVTGGLLFFAGAGGSIGLGIVSGLSFVAAAIVRLAQAVERVWEAQRAVPKARHAWSMPDPPEKEGGTGAV